MKVRTALAAVAVAGLCRTLAACDHVDEVTPRKFVGLAVAHAAPLKMKIANALLAHPGMPVPYAGALGLPPPRGAAPLQFDSGWVTAGGAIIIHNSKYAVLLIQEPTVTAGGVTWSCIVHPADAKPPLCGTDYENSLLRSEGKS